MLPSEQGIVGSCAVDNKQGIVHERRDSQQLLEGTHQAFLLDLKLDAVRALPGELPESVLLGPARPSLQLLAVVASPLSSRTVRCVVVPPGASVLHPVVLG